MDKKVTGIVSYLTIIGWIVAYILGEKEEAWYHMRQAFTLDIMWLVLDIALGIACAIISIIPFIGKLLAACLGVLNLIPLILAVIGIIYAVNDEEKELPVIGSIHLIR